MCLSQADQGTNEDPRENAILDCQSAGLTPDLVAKLIERITASCLDWPESQPMNTYANHHPRTFDKGQSLRGRIAKDPQLKVFKLSNAEGKRWGRQRGWTKLHSENAQGAINIQWDAPCRMLICRVVNRLGGTPHDITGHFMAYLLARFRGEIRAIHVIPQ